MRLRFKTALVLLGALLIGVLGGSAVNAYTVTGCRYIPGQISPITYKFQNVSSTYQNAVTHAQNVWDATSAPGYFSSTTASHGEIDIYDANYTSGDWAWVTYTCVGGLYSPHRTNMYFNTRTMNSLSAAQKSKVAQHELGHSYGLGHMSSGCHVMRQGSYKFTCGTTPSANDVAGVHAVY